MEEWVGILTIVISWLIGGIPFGFYIGWWFRGIDIRDWGSGNVGATNAIKVLGVGLGLLVFVLDTAKGFLPVFAAINYLHLSYWWVALVFLAPGLGHFRSFWMFVTEGAFSGGKSVATFLGATIALDPRIAGWAVLFWIVAVLISQYVSAGSMLAVVFAFCLSHWAYHLNPVYQGIFALAILIIFYAHDRNIGRLINGIEPKWYAKRGAHDTNDEAVFCFLAHPLTFSDYSQTVLTSWIPKVIEKGILTERMCRWLITKGGVMESDEITGIETPDGRKARGLIIGIPLLPDQIMDPKYKPILTALLQSAVVQAQRRGATVVGLGALLSSAAGGGTELQEWAKKRGLTITIDNGAAFTVAATIEALKSSIAPKKLEDLTVATIGASGLIGYALVKYLEGKVAKQIAIARSKGKIEGLSSLTDVLTSQEIKDISSADVIICSTSAPNPIINKENSHLVKKDAIVLDVAVPPDFDEKILDKRLDIQLIRCGLTYLPGQNVHCRTDFHFGTALVDKRVNKNILVKNISVQLMPACLSQSAILSFSRSFHLYASRGARIRPEHIDFFAKKAKEL
ncbi:MAG: glycerol-3-phosphate 1-O-acyltransferase PlsY, partial [Patescibacteria group bacterium]